MKTSAPKKTGEPPDRKTTDNPDGTVTVQILHPIRPPEDGDAPVAVQEVTIRNVYARDLELLDGVEGENTRINVLLAAVTGLSIDLVRRLAYADWLVVRDHVEKQMGKPPGIGAD